MATLDEMKQSLGTPVGITVFRKLNPLDYLTSYSHRGRYYTLREIARFDDHGLWSQADVWFSRGCERIYRKKASGGRWDRPELHRLLAQLRKADVFVVWKLDRLSRSLRDVLTIIMERLAEANAKPKSYPRLSSFRD